MDKPEREDDPSGETQERVRRRLLKLGVYLTPAILNVTSFLTESDADSDRPRQRPRVRVTARVRVRVRETVKAEVAVRPAVGVRPRVQVD
jgi:hypothetical protein